MRKLNKILVPIDFSEASARALKYALSLAEETRSELVALHVIEKTDDSDFFMSSVALLEGSPFPIKEVSRNSSGRLIAGKIPRPLEFHRADRWQPGQDNQENKDGQFAQGNDSDDSRRRHRPCGSGAAQAVVSQSGGFETHQTDPGSTLSRASGSSGRPPS
jgi:Universal stress protein family